MSRKLQELVTRLAHRDGARTEAMVQADVRQLLLDAPLGLSDDVLLESHTDEHRRIDVEVGATVIEVKKDLRGGSVRVDAMDQLRGYVDARQRKQGARYVGVLTDGAEWHCYHLPSLGVGHVLERVATITVDVRRPDVDALLVWLEGVLATARDLRPTPDEIQRRLGDGSSSHALDRATVRSLYEANKDSPAIATKRRLWARLLETALGTQFEESDDLFIEHTLLVNTADVIAHAVLGLRPETLVPRSVLYGGEFDAAGVLGVVESDFFDWVVDVPEGDKFIRSLCRRIVRFDWSAVEHDVLKVLYESVIAKETRKKLGEYYTPDWLAEEMVRVAVAAPLDERVLDPACGSGTFLFHAVRRVVDAATAAGLPTRQMLDLVTRRVFGMDLHPVAVSLARVTYLLAIGRDRLVDPTRGPIRVPVFLGDSIQWRKKTPDLWSSGELAIPVEDRRELVTPELKFPSALLEDSRKFDDLVSDLADLAAKKKPGKPPSLAGVFRSREIPVDQQPTITSTFHTMCRLHDEGRDHIWGYYIRNLARPEWLARPENRVDLLIGNPPWLAFRHMPGPMQEDFREMAEQRGLWHGQKVATHQDLSALFAVRAIELYLKSGGRFAFVMPSAALDRKQFAGFRAVRMVSIEGPFGSLGTAGVGSTTTLIGLETRGGPGDAATGVTGARLVLSGIRGEVFAIGGSVGGSPLGTIRVSSVLDGTTREITVSGTKPDQVLSVALDPSANFALVLDRVGNSQHRLIRVDLRTGASVTVYDDNSPAGWSGREVAGLPDGRWAMASWTSQGGPSIVLFAVSAAGAPDAQWRATGTGRTLGELRGSTRGVSWVGGDSNVGWLPRGIDISSMTGAKITDLYALF